MTGLKHAADTILHKAVVGKERVPGVVAMATDAKSNFYEGCAGSRELGTSHRMTETSVMCIFSCTKSVTGVATMQLVEEGKIKLSDEAARYIPVLRDVQVLEGFDDKGKPKTRAPKSAITVSQLLTHTSGLAYDLFNHDMVKYNEATKTPGIISASKAALKTVLVFDPGTRWEYGTNIDMLGQLVENVRGKKLGEVFREHIFTPLGMDDTAFKLTPAMHKRLAKLHQRGDDGKLVATEMILPQEPEFEPGGHGLYSTIGDYMKFIRMVLSDGAGEYGRVLKPETVALSAKSHSGQLKVRALPGAIPQFSHDAEFFPGMPKSWGLSYMINDEKAPTGRPAGSLAWAGLANLYYWIDRTNKIGGMWGTQMFPFADPVSVGGYLAFEKAIYQHLHKNTQRQ